MTPYISTHSHTSSLIYTQHNNRTNDDTNATTITHNAIQATTYTERPRRYPRFVHATEENHSSTKQGTAVACSVSPFLAGSKPSAGVGDCPDRSSPVIAVVRLILIVVA